MKICEETGGGQAWQNVSGAKGGREYTLRGEKQYGTREARSMI